MLERIRNKLKVIADKRYKAFILKSMHAKGGQNLCLAEHARINLITEGAFSVAIGKSVTIWPDVKISLCSGGGKEACLVFGEGVSLGNRTQLHVGERIEIGDGSLISWDCVIMDRDYHAINSEQEQMKPIIIGRHVLIGCRSMILKGVTIGDGAIVAAGLVVTRDVPSLCMVAGNPAKVVKEGVKWK